jgi:mannosyltransferase
MALPLMQTSASRIERSHTDSARHPGSSQRWRDPLVLGLLATAISSIASWVPSKWNDEAATQSAATRSLGQLWQMMHKIDAVHGLYYTAMHFWIAVFGTSNFALRAPSMLAVGAASAGVAVLGARVGNRQLAIFSAVAFMLLPRVTWMGMEARSYAFTAALAVWLTVALVALTSRQRRALWIVYAILGALGVILNVYLALLIVAHGMTLFLSRRRLTEPRRFLFGWAISSLLAAILAWPIVQLILGQTGQLPFARPTFSSVVNTLFLEQYFVGATPTTVRAVAVPPTSFWATAALVLACFGWLLMLAPVVRQRIIPTTSKENPLGILAIAVPWIVAPTALVIGYSLVATPMYTARYFSFTTPAAALLIGGSIAALMPRWHQIIAIGLIAVIASPVFISQRGPTAKNGTDWQQAASVIQTLAKPGQDIYYGPVRAGGSLSTSKVRDAYPTVLSELHDITLKSTGAQNGTLWDSQWPLTHAVTQLQKTPLLWVVLEHYGAPNPSNLKAVHRIEQAGLHLTQEWAGPATNVLLFTRPTGK